MSVNTKEQEAQSHIMQKEVSESMINQEDKKSATDENQNQFMFIDLNVLRSFIPILATGAIDIMSSSIPVDDPPPQLKMLDTKYYDDDGKDVVTKPNFELSGKEDQMGYIMDVHRDIHNELMTKMRMEYFLSNNYINGDYGINKKKSVIYTELIALHFQNDGKNMIAPNKK